MIDKTTILRNVYDELSEHDLDKSCDEFLENIDRALKANEVPAFDHDSELLSLVTFECWFQDTGYPPEVYMPSGNHDQDNMTQLRERWIGWATEIPGQQAWVSGSASKRQCTLDRSVHNKYPTIGTNGQYLGAIIKMYDDLNPKPASMHTIIGVVSRTILPHNEEVVVPAIHVLQVKGREAPHEHGVRDELIDYLATSFTPPDRLAGHLLLLDLISYPIIRPSIGSPLGSLSINFTRKDHTVSARLTTIVGSVCSRVVELPLSLSLLHNSSFIPKAIDGELQAGLLQLAENTVLIVDEDGMGGGGELQETAVRNLQALSKCVSDQTLRYDYPYMDLLKMDCAIKAIIVSEGKSIVPVDLVLPLRDDPPGQGMIDLDRFRAYIATRTPTFHALFKIPDAVTAMIQEDFIKRRQTTSGGEDSLKRRLRLARLVALTYDDATLSEQVWAETLKLEADIETRQIP